MAAAADKPDEPPTDAETTIDAAIKKLAKLEWVAAELVQEINMLNQKYSIKGSYRKGPNTRVYLRLTVVGPGRFRRHDASGLRRRNPLGLPGRPGLPDLPQAERQADPRTAQLARAQPELERTGDHSDGPRRTGNAAGRPAKKPQVQPQGRRRARRQESVEAARDLENAGKAWSVSTAGPSMPAGSCRLISRWTSRSIWARKTAGRTSSFSWAESPRLFETRRVGPDGRPIGSKSSIEKINPSEIRLTYSDVKLNTKLRLEEFAFTAPPSANVDDSTEALVKGLDQAIQDREASARKNEAAKKRRPACLTSRSTFPPPPGPDVADRDHLRRHKMEPTKPNGSAKPSKVEAIKLASQYLKTYVADEVDNGSSHFRKRPPPSSSFTGRTSKTIATSAGS